MATTSALPARFDDARDPADQAIATAWQVTLLLLALVLPTLLARALDERLLNGISVWDKPLKFEVSLALHFATLALLLCLVPPAIRMTRLVRWSIVVGAFAALAEILYIILQSARGRGSHFNLATPVETVAYNLMGLGAVLIVLASFIVGMMVWRHAQSASGRGLRLGASLGLTLGIIGTIIVGFMLGSMNGHWIGGVPTDATGLPIVGWSTTGGDLRVAHFIATHAMQGLPLVGLIADRLISANAARTVVGAATLVWLALVVATTVQALAGQPLLRL